MASNPRTVNADRVFLARAPGRVNLIGEHLDYNGLPVLPVAIDRHLVLTARPTVTDHVRCESAADGCGPVTFRLAGTIPAGPSGEWGNYLRAAGQALWQAHGPLIGFQGEVRSDLPVAAGLSSSSALVVATALALAEVNGLTLDGPTLMDLLAHGERYVGTAGGGMDQAVILGAREGQALHVSFSPLILQTIPWPEGWRLVVASSLTPAQKSGAARAAYNQRVEECGQALAETKARVGASEVGYRELLAGWDTETLLDAATLDPILFRRHRHVVTEARRVEGATKALREGDLAAFGKLMNESHESLRSDYEVSTPALDLLVECARATGAVGARLTGAGFGGSVVALVAASSVDGVLDGLWEGFYGPRGVRERDRDSVLFATTPGAGASITTAPSG